MLPGLNAAAYTPSTHEPIAIIGIGCRLPGGANSAQAFWQLLREGRSAISEVPSERWDLATHFDADPQTPLHQHVRHGGFVDGIDQFDAAFFGISPREAVCMDPQQRLLMEVAWQAIESAGQPLDAIRGTRTAVFMGISSSDYSSLLWASPESFRIPDNEPFVLPGNTGCIAANRLSYFFDLKGPSFTVDTACSSSLVAVHLACESLWRGESTAALVGGVQALIHPGIQSSFCKAGLLAPDGRCKSFDAAANGYVRSEGAGAVLLKPLSAAQADGDPIVALIHGTAVNSDGRSNGMVAPNLRAQVACVRAAFERAGIDPAATQYVEAHGTGTRQGDPIELRALGTVLGEGRAEEQPCRVGSVKTNLGHSETAAGITGLIKAALSIQHRQLPPSLNFRTPNPAIDFSGLKLQVQTELEPFPRADEPAVVGVSSFGFGGTNAHVVLSDAPKPPPPPRYGQRMPQQLLCVSARTEDALRQQAAQLAELLRSKPNLALSDLCASANVRRTHFVRRLVCLGADRAALQSQLEACASGGSAAAEAAAAVVGQASRRPGKLAFLFTGQGSQALGMARGLHEQHPLFREAFDRATALLDPLLDQPLASVLFPAEGAEEQAATLLNQTGFTQPALFVVGYALAQLWQSWGLKPDLLMGHSVGEIVAAHLAGVFSLEDAVKLVAARGRLMQALPKGGAMVALIAPAQQVQDLIDAVPSGSKAAAGLAIAAYNGPTNTVVSGPQKALDALVKVAQSAGIACHPLAVSHAFHSPAMAPMLQDFEQVLRQIRFSPPSRPLVSNVSGELAGPEIAQSDYWCDHVLSPVRFAQGMATLAAQGAVTFVELGAKPTLIGMGRQCLEGPFAWWPSLRPGQDDWQVILRSLAELHRSGYSINWKGFHHPFPHRQVALPGYPFQRQRYWWSRTGEGEAPASVWLGHILGDGVAAASMAPIPGALSAAAASSPEAVGPAGWMGLEPVELPGGQERRFQTSLSAAAPADLDDHRIRRQVVFPAAGFVQLALQAAQAQELPLTLAELSLDQPLRLSDANAAELQLVWGVEELTFHSRQCGSAAAWRSHGSCAAASLPRAAAPAAEPPLRGESVASAAEALDLSGFYGALAAFGLSYGPAFRSLVSLQRLGDRAWATVQRQQGAQDWALLDGCFQAVAATLDPEAAAGQLFLPVGFEAIHLQQLPLPDRLQCQVQLRPSDEPAFVLADLLLLPPDGQGDGTGPAVQPEPLGWIRGFRLRRLPRAALDWLFPLEAADASGAASLHEPGPADWLVRAEWEAIPAGDLAVAAAASTTSPPGLIRASELGPDPVAAVTTLLQLAQQAPPQDSAAPVWVLLDTPENPALSGALDGFAKAAALEQGQRQWLRIHLLPPAAPAAPDPGSTTADLNASLPWAQIEALAPSELALAWDGRQLLRQRLRPLPPERFRFATRSFGLLESLEPQPIAAPQGPSDPSAPGPGELELAVEATGLNFRDVLNALGLLRAYSRQLGLDEAAQVPFGGECVGTVTAVGPGVDPKLIGSRMLAALAVGSLASHVNSRAELCVPLPASLTPAEGASVSTAFLTAIYGLQTLAALKKGETVLIHAAAGGVGQAAVQVALRAGARVLATASAPKQQALLDQGVEAV
ncbi:MAG: acyltransferase domain-containing protein, partial [Cyanobacteria bacterium M_surface_7_m2_040]|nr:acyltransferase domain-containing protein [Cyanobacteria bacterium M_surface_7_m2_040]